MLAMLCSAACGGNTTSTHDFGGSAIVLSAPNIAGQGTINVTVSLHDSDGSAVKGAAVQVNAAGLSVVQVSSITDNNGNATASIVNPTAVGQHDITASVTVGSKPTTLTAKSTLQVLNPITAGGSDVATGVPLNVQAAAFADGVLNTGYTGTVAFTSTDAEATLPGNYTFTAGDHGVKLFSGGLLFQTAGSQTVTVTDTQSGKVLGTQSFQVAASAVGTLAWTTLPGTAATAGTAFSATLTVRDAQGQTITNYLRRVTFSSSDPNAVLPQPVTFKAANAGVTTVEFTLKTAGPQTITASDAAVASSPGPVAVSPGPATSFTVTPGNSYAAGASNSVTVQANDSYGNVASGYTGTISFTSTESGEANLPANYTFQATDTGTHVFNTVVICSIGTATVTATDTINPALQGTTPSFSVGAGTATHLRLTPSTHTWDVADGNNTVTVEGVDDCENLVPSYTGIGSFSSSDPQVAATLEQVNFSIEQGGTTQVQDQNLFMITAGAQILSATDATTNYTGDTNITVAPGNANNFLISFAESPAFVAHLNAITIDVQDAYGNITSKYNGGMVHLTSTDTNTVLPGDYQVPAGGHAVLGNANFLYYGTQQIAVADKNTKKLSGNANITVHQVRELAAHLGWTVCASMDDGSEMKCWGHYSNGEALSGSSPSRGQSPKDLGPNLPLASMGTGVKAHRIFTGQQHSCLIHQGSAGDPNNGKVKCWGENSFGQLGLGDVLPRGASPSQIGDHLPFVDLGTGRTAVSMGLGERHSCAILDTGKLVCWGFNGDGELGIDNPNSVGAVPGQMGDKLVPVILGTGRTAVEATAGGYHTCALMDDSNVKCWAYNGDGEGGTGNPNRQLGLNAGEMENAVVPLDFGGNHKAVHIAAGQFHSCALLDDGSVKCWGYGGHGELGSVPNPNNLNDHAVGNPNVALAQFASVPFNSGRHAVQIAMGFQHSCALLDDGNATCWGYNADGELGLNDPNDRGVAMPLPIAPINVGTGLKVLEIRPSSYNTCARLSNGTVKCWGYNGDGQDGLGVPNRTIGNDPNQNALDAMGDNLPSVKLY